MVEKGFHRIRVLINRYNDGIDSRILTTIRNSPHCSKESGIWHYNNTASLIGRRIGNEISIGHYLHPAKNEEVSMPGDDNPMITYNINSPGGKKLLEFFNIYFEELQEKSLRINE